MTSHEWIQHIPQFIRQSVHKSRDHGEMPITTFLPSRIAGYSSINFSYKLEQLNQKLFALSFKQQSLW